MQEVDKKTLTTDQTPEENLDSQDEPDKDNLPFLYDDDENEGFTR